MANLKESACEMGRREFLRLTLMSSAMLAAAGAGVRAEAETAEGAQFATLSPLAPGAVRPEGWLRLYLERQAAELGSRLPEVSWPFTGGYWAGEEKGESWWPWEQQAYWIDGATRLALVLDDRKLLDQVQAYLRYTLDHADADGYLGPNACKEPKENFHRWPHNVFFRGLTASCDSGVNPDAIEALRKHYLNDQASYSKPSRNVTNIEDILWCYAHTGDKRLLELAETAWHDYLRVATSGDDDGDLRPLRVYAATPIDAHGVTYAETAKLPAILFLYTGKAEYLKFALATQRRIFDHHMLISGVPSTAEHFRTRTSLDSHETCDITDHTWSWGYMLMATGDARWADAVERACINAGFGAIKKDWKALQYFSCPNQFLATLNSDHNEMAHGGRMMAFQPNPGQRTACCGGNVHRLYPNFVIRMWMKDKHGGLTAALYGPSRVKTTVGTEAREIEIVQQTGYPFEEQIHFTLNPISPVEFPFSFRIPAWCAEPHLAVNGERAAMPQVNKGFATLQQRFSPGDIVTLTLPMKTAISRWPQNGVGVEHGPLVYSLAIKENWTPVVEEKYTTAEFPSWNAQPESAWNYGLAVDEEHMHDQIKVHRKAMTPDPWVDPPVTLTVPAKTITGWELLANPDNPMQQFTPPLPELADLTVGAEDRLTLGPYGSTHLRVTIFPDVKNATEGNLKRQRLGNDTPARNGKPGVRA